MAIATGIITLFAHFPPGQSTFILEGFSHLRLFQAGLSAYPQSYLNGLTSRASLVSVQIVWAPFFNGYINRHLFNVLFSLDKIKGLLGLITDEGPGVYFVVGWRSLRILHRRLQECYGCSGRGSAGITVLFVGIIYYPGDFRSVMAVVARALLALHWRLQECNGCSGRGSAGITVLFVGIIYYPGDLASLVGMARCPQLPLQRLRKVLITGREAGLRMETYGGAKVNTRPRLCVVQCSICFNKPVLRKIL